MCETSIDTAGGDEPITLIAMRDKSVVSVRDELQALIDAADSHPEVQAHKKNQLFATLTGPRSAVLPFAQSFDRALIFEEDKALNAITPPGPFEGDAVQSDPQDEALQFEQSDEINEL